MRLKFLWLTLFVTLDISLFVLILDSYSHIFRWLFDAASLCIHHIISDLFSSYYDWLSQVILIDCAKMVYLSFILLYVHFLYLILSHVSDKFRSIYIYHIYIYSCLCKMTMKTTIMHKVCFARA